jgi:hypothetical protein
VRIAAADDRQVDGILSGVADDLARRVAGPDGDHDVEGAVAEHARQPLARLGLDRLMELRQALRRHLSRPSGR